MLNRIESTIKSPKIKVVSFDIFDTLLVRPFWKPSDLFYFLDDELANVPGAENITNFSPIRKEAERYAREAVRNSGREDITIDEIYGWLSGNGIIAEEAACRLMKKEMELELRYLEARESAKALLQYALDAGKRVILISDMYLPSSFIAKVLEKNKIPAPEKIFVSGERGLLKRTGSLFKTVSAELDVPLGSFVHIGDNRVSDVIVPRKLGMKAFLYAGTGNLLSGENCRGHYGTAFRRAFKETSAPFSNKDALQNLGVRCMMKVAANMVYDDPFRKNYGRGDYANDARLFGCLALGPYCFSHALWLYRIAKETEADRVLFFSRDGFLVRKAFTELGKHSECAVKESYVHISRRSTLPFIMAQEKKGMYKRWGGGTN